MEEKFKLAIIYGEDDSNKNIYDGKIETYGNIEDASSHMEIILDASKNKYPEITTFSQLDYRFQAEVPAYILTRLGNIVFFDITKYKNGTVKYGHNGFLMLPDTITPKQKESLETLIAHYDNYSISINYDLTLHDGMIDGRFLQSTNQENALHLLQRYYKIMDKSKQK